MTFLGTNLTVFLLFERSVQKSQLSKLLLLVHILFIVDDYQHLLNHICRGINRSLIVASNDHMKWFVIRFHNFSIASSSSTFFDRPSATNGDFASRLGLQFLLRLSTRSNDQSDKVVLGMFLHGNANLFRTLALEET